MSCHTDSYNTMNDESKGYPQNSRTQMSNYPDMQTRPSMPANQRNQMGQYPQSTPFMQTTPGAQPATTAITTGTPIPFPANGAPTTVQNPYYTAGFLKKFIGRDMRVEFLIGTNGALVDRTGKLLDVGASYIVLQPYLSDDYLMADLYSIKFVTIFD